MRRERRMKMEEREGEYAAPAPRFYEFQYAYGIFFWTKGRCNVKFNV